MDTLRDAIRECSTGNRDAFRAIVDHCQDKVFRYLLSRAPTREDALDMMQEVFIDVWQALPRFRYRSDQQFFGFIFTITRRKLARFYESREQTLEFNEAYIKDNFELAVEDYRYLMRSIASLKPKYQELLRLRYWGSLSWKEVAAALHITETAAKVRHHRAIRKLQSISPRT